MSSPDQHTPWGDGPAPPPMMSPYGMPLSDGGPDGPGGYGSDGHGPHGYGPGGSGGPGGPGSPDRRRKTLIASALAVVAVVGIGGAIAFMSGGSPKHDKTAPAGAGSGVTSSPAGNGWGFTINGGGGKPDGDDLAGASTNGAQGSNLQGAPSSASPGTGPTGPISGGHPTGSNPAHPTTSTNPAHPVTSAPGGPAPSASAPAVPKPSASTSSAPPPKTTTAAAPSSDCTYLDLPPAKMPQIKEGSGNVNAVKELQCLLKKSELGIKPLAVDGSWGPDTQSAMTAFQSCNNAPTVHSPGGTPPYPKLAVDGVAGPQTWADLYFWDNQYFNGTSYYCNGTR